MADNLDYWASDYQEELVTPRVISITNSSDTSGQDCKKYGDQPFNKTNTFPFEKEALFKEKRSWSMRLIIKSFTRLLGFIKSRFFQGWPSVILVVVAGATQFLRVTTLEKDCGNYFDLCDPIISEEGQLIIIATTILALAMRPRVRYDDQMTLIKKIIYLSLKSLLFFFSSLAVVVFFGLIYVLIARATYGIYPLESLKKTRAILERQYRMEVPFSATEK